MAKYRVKREPVVQPLDQSIKLVALTKGQVAVVDAKNYARVMQWPWCAYWHPRTKTFYARRGHGGIHMQRFIMNAKPGQMVDHRDGDTLNNREGNLRFATSSQNSCNRKLHSNNRSGNTGVYWRKDLQQWQVQIFCKGRRKHLGYFDDLQKAIKARRDAEFIVFGEFARVRH